MSTEHHSVLIAGGGTAGITVAARLENERPELDVAIVEPNEHHDYQPLWTMVGAGIVPKEDTRRAEKDYIPKGVTWIKDRVRSFEPDKNALVTEGGRRITYDQLVVALGIKLDWHKIKGLEGQLGKGGICSNYSYETVDSTWRFLSEFSGGDAVFTFPAPPIKCAGAPQKIMYLADEVLRRRGVRSKSRIHYAAGTAAIFGVKRYRDALEPIVARKEIQTYFRRDLVEVRPASREAIFRHLDGGDELVLKYDLLHVVPPQSAPSVIAQGGLGDAAGWVDVHKHTLQHTRFANVFSLGDASSAPTSKTGAAVRKQAPVLVDNLLALREGRPLRASYDGYASCPLVTGFGKLILAEFDYDGRPMESFPFDQSQERYSMYALKLYGLPELYWNGMLRGRA
jgi:sulfide:quinone oxidoreductase